MIAHISPLYTIAQICAVALIAVLLVGIAITDWEMVYLRYRGKKIARKKETPPEWADPDKWERSR